MSSCSRNRWQYTARRRKCQTIQITTSATANLCCGVAPGSVFGPVSLHFTLFPPLGSVFRNSYIAYYFYADDTLLYPETETEWNLIFCLLLKQVFSFSLSSNLCPHSAAFFYTGLTENKTFPSFWKHGDCLAFISSLVYDCISFQTLPRRLQQWESSSRETTSPCTGVLASLHWFLMRPKLWMDWHLLWFWYGSGTRQHLWYPPSIIYIRPAQTFLYFKISLWRSCLLFNVL